MVPFRCSCVRSKTDKGKLNGTTPGTCQDLRSDSVPFSFLCPLLDVTQEQRRRTATPTERGSWQSCVNVLERNRSKELKEAVLTLLLQLLTQDPERSGSVPLLLCHALGDTDNGKLGPGSPHSQLPVVRTARTQERNHSGSVAPVSAPRPVTTGSWVLAGASRCHVLERTQEQRTGTTPGSWQSSLSFFSFPLSLERTQEQRNGTTPGSWQSSFSFVTSWSGHRSNGTEPLLGPGSVSSFSFPLSRDNRSNGRNHSWVLESSLSSFSFPLSRLGDTGATERKDCQDPGVVPFRCFLCPLQDVTTEQAEGGLPGPRQFRSVPPSASCVTSWTDTGATERRTARTQEWFRSVALCPLQDVTTGSNGRRTARTQEWSSLLLLSRRDNGKLKGE